MRRSTRLILALAVSAYAFLVCRLVLEPWLQMRAIFAEEMPVIPLRLECTIFLDSLDVPAFVFVPGIPGLAFAWWLIRSLSPSPREPSSPQGPMPS